MNNPLIGSYNDVEAAGRSPTKVVVYLRACPGPKADHSIEVQKKACLEWIEQEKKVLVAEEVELTSGGTNLGEWSGFQRALEALEKYQAGVLLIHKLDRLGRHAIETLQVLLQARNNLGFVVAMADPPETPLLRFSNPDDEKQFLQDMINNIHDMPSTNVSAEPSLRIWTYDPDDGDFFIASSAEEAAAMFKDWMGSTVEETVGEDLPFEPLPEDKIFHFSGEDGEGPHERELPAYFVKKYPKGYFASANF